MATKHKPQGPRCKKFEIWTKMAKVPKPQGPKWQFTQSKNYAHVILISKCLLRCAVWGSSPPRPGSAPPSSPFRPHRRRRERPHEDDGDGPPPLSHTYTYNIYIYILGLSPHFLTSILFVPSSHPIYVADHPLRMEHHHTA
ncbi:hypothetical protein HanPI659440_Chr08g0307731 [Helianthus annuus]|nr:hypothetical protein HanPI659440_Chr08g0307731 [Helianthus annuus]